MKEYTQGICEDGAAILEDGVPMTIEEVLQKLNELNKPAIDKEKLLARLKHLFDATGSGAFEGLISSIESGKFDLRMDAHA